MPLRAGSIFLVVISGCSTTVPGERPGEEGMYADDDVGGGGDGVLVRCGNLSGANYYWEVHGTGALKVVEMPVVCVGTIDTPGFDYESAVAIDGKYRFPEWEAEIQGQCATACEDAHQAGTNESPVCLGENFDPNWAVGSWEPADGANCDSSIPPDLHVPEI